MNDFSLLLRRIGSLAAVATIFAAIGATPGCGAADEDPPTDAPSSTASDPLAAKCYASSASTYTAPFYSLPQTTCAMQSTTILWAGREFSTIHPGADAQTQFEARLAAHGCTTAVPDGKPVSEFQKSSHFSISLCPDACATWTAVADFANVDPVFARMTRKTPTSCLIDNDNAIPSAPAGKIYVIWDPTCPGVCRLQLNPYEPWLP